MKISMTKTRTFFLILSSLFLFGSLLSGQTPVFYEDWSLEVPGDQAHQLTNWEKRYSGNNGVFTVYAYPFSPEMPIRNIVAPDWPDGISNSVRRIYTTNSYQRPDSFAYNTQLAFGSTGQYTRLIVEDAANPDPTLRPHYYLDIYTTTLYLKRNLSAGEGEELLAQYNFESGDLHFHQFYQFTLQVLEQGDYLQLNVLQDGVSRIQYTDTSPITLSEQIKLGIGFRNVVDVMIGDVSLTAIPETAHFALLLGAIGLICYMRKSPKISF